MTHSVPDFWSSLDYISIVFQNTNVIEVAVPVGDLDQAPQVVGATTLIVCGATIYLMGAIFRKTDPVVDP